MGRNEYQYSSYKGAGASRMIQIFYGDFAIGAKENFVATASESQFNTLDQLNKYDLQFKKLANPCELYQTVLDGTAEAFPSNENSENIGYWSEQISENNGYFNEPIVLTFQSENTYSSKGITLKFDEQNNVFATRIKVEWYGLHDKIIEKNFSPDSPSYFCDCEVEEYNKIIITFYAINMPKNKLKLTGIDYGRGVVFYKNEILNATQNQSIDPISTSLPINTFSCVLNSKKITDFSFASEQKIQVSFNGNHISTNFIKSAKRKSKNVVEINCENYISKLEEVDFVGGIYKDEPVKNILMNISSVSGVPFEIDSVFDNINVSGYIPYTDCRNALMIVAFSVQGVVDASNSDFVKFVSLKDDFKQTIPKNRIKRGQSFDYSKKIEGVELVVCSYGESRQPVYLYKAETDGVGNNIKVVFSEPAKNLKIGYIEEDENGKEVFVENSLAGNILESGTNYAIINAYENCVLKGNSYFVSKQQIKKTTENRQTNNKNIVSIGDVTLIESNNIDKILNSCYNYLVKRRTINVEIVEGKHVIYGEPIKYGEKKYGEFKYGEKHPNTIYYDMPVNLGDNLYSETEYLGIVDGRLIEQNFNLNGNIIVKKAVLK